MKFLRQFGKFWYDFLVGDDWRLAIGVAVTVAGVFFVARHGVNAWWLLPVAVALVLTISVAHGVHRHE